MKNEINLGGLPLTTRNYAELNKTIKTHLQIFVYNPTKFGC